MRAVRPWDESSIPKWIRWPLIAVVMVTYVVPGLFSSYRAWVQVKSLDLFTPGAVLRAGDTIRVKATSWARTHVEVDLLLVQGARVDTLAVRVIPGNHNASIDPRVRRDSITLVVTPDLLSGYAQGRAIVKATAIGRPQWLRTPPPLVREKAVQLEKT